MRRHFRLRRRGRGGPKVWRQFRLRRGENGSLDVRRLLAPRSCLFVNHPSLGRSRNGSLNVGGHGASLRWIRHPSPFAVIRMVQESPKSRRPPFRCPV